MSKERIETTKVGEVVSITSAGRLLEATAQPSCGDQHNGHWYCVTHREHFPNQFMKDDHIHEGGHKLVWICHQHGAEQP